MIKWLKKSKDGRAKKNKSVKDDKERRKEECYLRWEYEENPPQSWRGLIFSPCPLAAIRSIGSKSSSDDPPEEVTLTQMMKFYQIVDDGKSLIGELGSCVSIHARFAPELRRDVAGERIHYVLNPHGSIEVLALDRKTTGELRHRNITRVFGWCEDRDSHTFSVVQEPLAGDTLYSHLHFPQLVHSPGLSWQRRYSAARDLAAAVHYLNEEYENTCLHTEINTHNVFFDGDGNAKLANLGAFKFEGESSITVLVMGTSYCFTFNCKGEKHSREANARGLGIVALEMACGIEQAALEDKKLSAWQYAMEFFVRGDLHGAVDPMLGDDFDREKIERLLLVGLWCAQPDPESRASTKQAIKYLDFDAAPPPQLPMSSLQAFSKSRKDLEGSIAELRAARAAQAAQQQPATASRVYRALSPSIMETLVSDNNGYHPRQHSRRHSEDDLLPVPVPGGAEEARENVDQAPVPAGDNPDVVEAFDIGVPPGYRCSGEPLREFQVKLVESVLEGLREGLEREPGFKETLEMVRKYTQALVALGIPVGNWNTLVQDILRAARLVERFKRGEVGGEDPRTRDLGALREKIEQCTRKMEGLEEEKGMLAVRQVELQNRFGKIQGEIKEVEEELKLVETRKARETQLLDRSRKEVEMLEMVQSVLRKLSEFTCGEE